MPKFFGPKSTLSLKCLHTVALAVCLSAQLVPSAIAGPESAPIIYMPLTERHFGDVFAGEELDQVFPIRNDGDAPLEMENKALTFAAPPASNHAVRAVAFSSYREPQPASLSASMSIPATHPLRSLAPVASLRAAPS